NASRRTLSLRRVLDQQGIAGRNLGGAVAVLHRIARGARHRDIRTGAVVVAAASARLRSDSVMLAVLQRTDRIIGFICKWGVIGCLLGLFFLLPLAVVVRIVPFVAISGYDEIVELLFAWLTFLGALALWREGALYRVVVIESALAP